MASVLWMCGQSWAVESWPGPQVAGQAHAVQHRAGVQQFQVVALPERVA